MPKAFKEFPAEPFKIYISPANAVAIRAKFRDPGNSRGTRYGEISKFFDSLASEYFRKNPVISTAQLENPNV